MKKTNALQLGWLVLLGSAFVTVGCDDGTTSTNTSSSSSSSSSGDVSSSSSGTAGSGGMGSGGMGGMGGMGSGGMSTGGMGGAAGSSATSSSSGMMGGNFTAKIVDDATFIDCKKMGADQLGGTAFVSFQNDTGAPQTAKLTKASMNFVNGANKMDMTLNMQWSAANPGTPDQVPVGASPSVIYKAQPGAPAPAKNPCDFCPFMGGNGNTLPSLTLTLEWDVNGTKISDVTTPELKSCL